MIDETELEYVPGPKNNYLLYGLVAFILVALAIIVPGGLGVSICLTVVIIPLVLVFERFVKHTPIGADSSATEDINMKKSSAIKAAYAKLSETEKKNAFLQIDHSNYTWNKAGTGKPPWQPETWWLPGRAQSHRPASIIKDYRIFILSKRGIKIVEIPKNNVKFNERSIRASDISKIILEKNIGGRALMIELKGEKGMMRILDIEMSSFTGFIDALQSAYPGRMTEIGI